MHCRQHTPTIDHKGTYHPWAVSLTHLYLSRCPQKNQKKNVRTRVYEINKRLKKNASFCVLFFWRSCFVNTGPNASALCSHDWLYPHPTLPIFEKKMSLRLPSQSLSSASSGLDEPASQEVFAKRRLNSSRREMVSLVLFSLFFSRVFFFFSKECSCFCLSWLSACFSTLPFRRCIYRCSQGPRLTKTPLEPAEISVETGVITFVLSAVCQRRERPAVRGGAVRLLGLINSRHVWSFDHSK